MREVDRLEMIREVVGKRLVQREAGEQLRLSVRQVKRLVRRYRELTRWRWRKCCARNATPSRIVRGR